jgi:hypothetical protein
MGAEKFEFNPEHVIKILLESEDLLDLDQKVLVSQDIDGSILYVLKLNNNAAKGPWTKKIVTLDGDTNEGTYWLRRSYYWRSWRRYAEGCCIQGLQNWGR